MTTISDIPGLGGKTGERVSVILTFLVGGVAVGTGIVHITYTPMAPAFETIIPETVRTTVGFTLTLSGFVTLLTGYALTNGYRVGWYGTVVLMPVIAIQGVIQSSPVAVPLVVVAIGTGLIVAVHRQRFSSPVGLSTAQIATGIAVLGVQGYGTVGAYTLREEFIGVETVLDAFYFTLVTASTVGYGDITATTQQARLFAMSVLIFGTASFGAAIGVLLGPVIESRLAAGLGRVRDRQLERLTDHVVVLGYSDLTEPVITKLHGRTDFVVVSRQSRQVEELTERGITAVSGDPGDESMLRRVQVPEAAAVITATTDDAVDAFTALTVRELADDIRIIAAVTNAENVSKLRRAGADVVIDPADVGAQLLVEAAGEDHQASSVGA